MVESIIAVAKMNCRLSECRSRKQRVIRESAEGRRLPFFTALLLKPKTSATTASVNALRGEEKSGLRSTMNGPPHIDWFSPTMSRLMTPSGRARPCVAKPCISAATPTNSGPQTNRIDFCEGYNPLRRRAAAMPRAAATPEALSFAPGRGWHK